MQVTPKRVLTKIHVLFLVQSSLIGTGVLKLPQSMSAMGYSQAFMPIVFGIIATITLYPILWLCSKFPNHNLFEINKILLGKVLGTILNSILILKFTVICASTISTYMLLIQSTALPEHTLTFPVLFFLILIIYLIKGDIFTIARLCILSLFLTIPMIFFTQYTLEKGQLSHIFPLFNFTFEEFYQATKNGYLSFLGYEQILFYYPYIIHQKSAFKYATIGIWVSTSLMLTTTLISVMYFSEWQIENIEFAMLNIYKAGEYAFIERIDIILVTLWILLVITTVAIYIWSASKGLKTLIFKKTSIHVYLIATCIYVLLMLPISQKAKDNLYTVSDYAMYFMVVWPIFLIMIYIIRKKRGLI